jgi:hypothetical protein
MSGKAAADTGVTGPAGTVAAPAAWVLMIGAVVAACACQDAPLLIEKALTRAVATTVAITLRLRVREVMFILQSLVQRVEMAQAMRLTMAMIVRQGNLKAT